MFSEGWSEESGVAGNEGGLAFWEQGREGMKGLSRMEPDDGLHGQRAMRSL